MSMKECGELCGIGTKDEVRPCHDDSRPRLRLGSSDKTLRDSHFESTIERS